LTRVALGHLRLRIFNYEEMEKRTLGNPEKRRFHDAMRASVKDGSGGSYTRDLRPADSGMFLVTGSYKRAGQRTFNSRDLAGAEHCLKNPLTRLYIFSAKCPKTTLLVLVQEEGSPLPSLPSAQKSQIPSTHHQNMATHRLKVQQDQFQVRVSLAGAYNEVQVKVEKRTRAH